jgi:pimeloyl-ACP methyl ester carboxylesterase
MVSEVRYARSSDVHIAYRVAGEGPFDVVLVPGTTSHVELAWEVPFFRALFKRIASFARLIHFDKRGTGMSDAADAAAPLEVRMDDVRAVMDAVGSERASIFGMFDGAPMSTLFAATYPDRTWALILDGAIARSSWAQGYPWGTPEMDARAALEEIVARPNDPARLADVARLASPNATEEERAALVNYWRHGASPGARLALMKWVMSIDVRDVLPAVRVPTLILQHGENPQVPQDAARFVADQIPGATYVELHDKGNIPPVAESEPYLREVQSSSNVRGQWTGIPSPIAFSRRCFSPTSSPRANTRHGSAIAGGAISSNNITSSSVANCFAIAASRWTLRATVSLPASTGRRARSAARARLQTQCRSWASRSVPACTRASARSSTAR